MKFKLVEEQINYNANPNNKNEDDCVIRALSLAYDMRYNNVKSELNLLARKNNFEFNTEPIIKAFIDKYGFQEFINNEVSTLNIDTVEKFSNKYNHGVYVVLCSNRTKQDTSNSFHLVTIVDSKIYDTWDSSNYYVIKAWKIKGHNRTVQTIEENCLMESKSDRQKLIDYAGETLAKKFFDIKHYIQDPEQKDLYYWLNRPVQELQDFIYKFEKKDNLIYEDTDWKVYKVVSPEMLTKLVGRHRIWCLQSTDGGLDWNYHVGKCGTKYLLYINKNTHKKYIKGTNPNNFMEDGVWDETDRQVHDKSIINSLPKINIEEY